MVPPPCPGQVDSVVYLVKFEEGLDILFYIILYYSYVIKWNLIYNNNNKSL